MDNCLRVQASGRGRAKVKLAYVLHKFGVSMPPSIQTSWPLGSPMEFYEPETITIIAALAGAGYLLADVVCRDAPSPSATYRLVRQGQDAAFCRVLFFDRVVLGGQLWYGSSEPA